MKITWLTCASYMEEIFFMVNVSATSINSGKPFGGWGMYSADSDSTD